MPQFLKTLFEISNVPSTIFKENTITDKVSLEVTIELSNEKFVIIPFYIDISLNYIRFAWVTVQFYISS